MAAGCRERLEAMLAGPPELNLHSQGRFVTAHIEAENNRAADIDLATLTLSVDGVPGTVDPAPLPTPHLLHFDGDLNINLEVKFDRAALNAALTQIAGDTAIVRTGWLYADGTDGTASAQVRVIR